MMRRRLLLFLSANRLHAQLMAGGRIVTQQDFDNSHEGREKFAAFLQSAKLPAYLLVDLIEEDFRHEAIPHLSGRNRSALLKRKFEQYYRGTPFRHASLLQRHKTGRGDDEMLLSALTNPALITPWLDIIWAQQIPLAGIYSVPQVSAPLLGNNASDHLLLISLERAAGLRQSYFNKHRLQLSRLTPAHAMSSFQDAVAKEIGRTCQYLKSLSLLPEGKVLDVRIIGYRDDLAELQKKLPEVPDMRYDFAGLDEVATQLGVNCHFADSDASQIFLHVLADKPSKAHYANAGHTHHFTLWQLRNALDWMGRIVLVGSLLWGAANVVPNSSKVTAAESLKIQAQRTSDEAQKIARGLNGALAPAADMKAAVSIMQELGRYSADPQAILKPVSAVLGRFPQIELDNIDWRANATGPEAADAPAIAGPITGTGTIITIKASLQGFTNDYRAELSYLERFQRELGAAGYQVTMITKPLDVGTGGSITDRRETQEKALDFSLRLERKVPA